MKRIACLTTVAIAASVAFAAPALAAGTTELSRKQVARIVADTTPGQPAKCYVAGGAQSDARWAIVAYRAPAPTGCVGADGYWVVHRTTSGWIDTQIAAVVTTCDAMRKGLARAGAPASVFRDFKASGACQKVL